MNEDNFDEEISLLYQQRKREIIAPEIDMSIHPKRIENKYSLASILAFVCVGSAASFSIFAIISNLTSAPKVTLDNFTINHAIELKQIRTDELDEKVLVVKQVLPPKPFVAESNKSQPLTPVTSNVSSELTQFELSSAQIKMVIMPKIKEPHIALKPIYQVMPKYTAKAIQANKAGEIRLRYQISPAGTVENIEVVSSSVGRILKKSAVQALAQWQFELSDNYQKNNEIIFDFNADK